VASKKQIVKIHILAKHLALDEDTYRDVLGKLTGKRSCRDLSWAEASRVIAYLEKVSPRRPRAERPRRWDDLGEFRPGMASPAQLRLIEALWKEIAFSDPKATLRKFLFKRWTVSDLRFLTERQAYEAIEAIKAIRERYLGRRTKDGTGEHI